MWGIAGRFAHPIVWTLAGCTKRRQEKQVCGWAGARAGGRCAWGSEMTWPSSRAHHDISSSPVRSPSEFSSVNSSVTVVELALGNDDY